MTEPGCRGVRTDRRLQIADNRVARQTLKLGSHYKIKLRNERSQLPWGGIIERYLYELR